MFKGQPGAQLCWGKVTEGLHRKVRSMMGVSPCRALKVFARSLDFTLKETEWF